MPYPISSSDPLAYVGLGLQSVKGTPVAPTLFVPYRSPVTLDHGQGGDEIFEAGTGPYVNRNMKTAHDPSGGFALGGRPNTLARLIAWALGTSGAPGGAGPYDHVSTVAEAARTWLSIEQAAGDDGDIIERFVDALIKGVTLSIEGNNDLMAAFTWTSLTAAFQATAATAAYESGLAGVSPGSPLRSAEATYTIDGVSTSNVQMWELALEWNLDEDIRLSAVTREDFLKFSISGKIKVKQLLNDSATADVYRKVAYGDVANTAPDPDYFGSGDCTVTLNNGLLTTDERQIQIVTPEIDWITAKYTDLDPSGATLYVEREGIVKKVGGTEFVTVNSKTGDALAYVT